MLLRPSFALLFAVTLLAGARPAVAEPPKRVITGDCLEDALQQLTEPVPEGRISNPGQTAVHKSGYVHVERGDQRTTYLRTNRGLKHVHATDEQVAALRGKKVLDIGTGGGAFVDDLRSKGVAADGLDIQLTDRQHTKPYFMERDALHNGIPDATYDAAFSHYSIFTYHSDDQVMMHAALTETLRVLKPGGILRIGPFQQKDVAKFTGYLNGLPVQVRYDSVYYLEITKRR